MVVMLGATDMLIHRTTGHIKSIRYVRQREGLRTVRTLRILSWMHIFYCRKCLKVGLVIHFSGENTQFLLFEQKCLF